MPKNTWEYVVDNNNPKSPFMGWQIDCDRFHDNQFHGLYRIRNNFCGGLYRFKNDSWTRWDVPPMGIPIPLIIFDKGGSERFTIQKDVRNIASWRIETTNNLYLYIGVAEWSIDRMDPEWSCTTLSLSTFGLSSVGGKESLIIPLGSQSAMNQHSGFGLIHVFRQRGKVFEYLYSKFMEHLVDLLNSPEKIHKSGDDEFLIVGKAMRVNKVAGRQRFRWCLVAKLRNDKLIFHTMIPKQDSEAFRKEIGVGNSSSGDLND